MAEKQTYIPLSSGATMPALALGTWTAFKENDKVKLAVKKALQCGIRHVDTAYAYKSENAVGQAIQEAVGENIVNREDVFVTTKLWCTFHEADKVRLGLEESLARLGLTYVDLLLIHWPMSYEHDEAFKEFAKYDENGVICLSQANVYTDTWSEMEKLYDAGLAKAIGLSNFNSKQIQKILDSGHVKPHVHQIEIHPYLIQEPLVEFCRERGIPVMSYAPLVSPGTTSGIQPTVPVVFDDPTLKEVASKHNKSIAQVILRWLIQRGLAVTVKSVTPSRIEENVQIWDFKLSGEDMNAISKLNRNFRILNETVGKHHKEWPFNEDY